MQQVNGTAPALKPRQQSSRPQPPHARGYAPGWPNRAMAAYYRLRRRVLGGDEQSALVMAFAAGAILATCVAYPLIHVR